MATNENSIQASQYLRFARGDVLTTLALVRELVLVAPVRPTEKVLRTLKRMKKKGEVLAERYAARQRVASGETLRPYDQAADNAWGALHGRLDLSARVPAEISRRGPRAAELRDSLFPDGLRFLNLEYRAQWAAAEVRLRRIEDEGLTKEIEQIAGVEVFEYVKKTHEAYGNALGLTRKKAASESSEDLWTTMNEVYEAISGYALQVTAMWDPEDSDADAIAQVVRASLAPIDAMRERGARKGAGGNGEGNPEEPQPPSPEGPKDPKDPKDPIKT